MGVLEGDVVTRVAGVEWVSLAVRNSPLFLYSKFWVSSDIACVKRSAVGKPSGWVDIYFWRKKKYIRQQWKTKFINKKSK